MVLVNNGGHSVSRLVTAACPLHCQLGLHLLHQAEGLLAPVDPIAWWDDLCLLLLLQIRTLSAQVDHLRHLLIDKPLAAQLFKIDLVHRLLLPEQRQTPVVGQWGGLDLLTSNLHLLTGRLMEEEQSGEVMELLHSVSRQVYRQAKECQLVAMGQVGMIMKTGLLFINKMNCLCQILFKM